MEEDSVGCWVGWKLGLVCSAGQLDHLTTESRHARLPTKRAVAASRGSAEWVPGSLELLVPFAALPLRPP